MPSFKTPKKYTTNLKHNPLGDKPPPTKEQACLDREGHMKKYNPEWYKTKSSSDKYSIWLKKLIELSKQCKGLITDSNNLSENVCEEDIGVLSDILYQLNLGQLGGKKGGSKQTGGVLIPELLTKLNGWIYRHQDEISDCAKYFLKKIYGAVAEMINETTLHQDSYTLQFLITVISYLNQDVPLPYESEIKAYIQSFLFQNIQAVSDLQTTISNLSLRDLAYYILLGINLYQYVDPAKGVVLGAIDTISNTPLINYIKSEAFLKLLYELSQSRLITAGLLVNEGFKSLPPDKQVKIKNIYTLIDHNITRLILEYIKNGYTGIDEKIKGLLESNNAIILQPFDEHLKKTFIEQKMANTFEIAKITNEIQIEKVNINDASLDEAHDTEITRLKDELTNLKTQLRKILPPGPELPPPGPAPLYPPPVPPKGGKRGKSTRRKIGSRKNKRVQKKKSTKKR